MSTEQNYDLSAINHVISDPKPSLPRCPLFRRVTFRTGILAFRTRTVCATKHILGCSADNNL